MRYHLIIFICLVALVSTPQRLLAHGTPIDVGTQGGSGPVTLTAQQQETIGLKTAKAQLRDIDTVLVLNARVKANPDAEAIISTRIDGHIEKLYVKIGDKVHKGQKLALIQSRQISDPPVVVPINAIADGIISERLVTQGQPVNPSTELFHIINLSQVLLEAEVYEEDIGKIKLNQATRVRVLGWPDDVFEGEVTFIAASVDVEKHTLAIGVAIPNPDGKLHPGMFARAAIILARHQGLLAVPKEAVLDDNAEKFVFVQTANTFDRVDVQTGVEDDAFVEIKEGLVPDDRVVTVGNREVYTAWAMGSHNVVRPSTDTD